MKEAFGEIKPGVHFYFGSGSGGGGGGMLQPSGGGRPKSIGYK